MSKTAKNRYCRDCGSELKKISVDACNIEVHHYDSAGGCWWDLASKFDPETGEINEATLYQCPNYRRRWYGENHHDIFVEYKGDIEWGVREKKHGR